MDNKELLINQICYALLCKEKCSNFTDVKALLKELGTSTLGDIYAELKED